MSVMRVNAIGALERAVAEAFVLRDTLYLFWLGNPAQPRPVGEISLVLGGRAVGLRYGAQWLQEGFPLSQDLPLMDQLFIPRERDCAAGALDDARPDRWGERVIRKFEVAPRLSILEYLLFAGDDRYGALGVSQNALAYQPWSRGPAPAFAQLEQMAEVVRMVLNNESVPERQRALVRPGASLGGARPKSLIEMEGRQWLVKFPEDDEMDTPLVEHASMLLAAECGINVAPTRSLKLASGHAVAVQRFDRQGERRVHAVSAHVALRAAGEEYGYPELAQLLRRVAPAEQIASLQEQLFRRMVFNILIDNTDDHEKNHALLRQDDGRYVLAPAFDVLPTAQGLGFQLMKVGERGNESSLENAMTSCAQFGLRPAAARQLIADLCAVVALWKKRFAAAGVSKRDIEYLARFVDRDWLREQRGDFNRGKSPSRLATPKKRPT
jgi:serine/threonine-protein kinase HipA